MASMHSEGLEPLLLQVLDDAVSDSDFALLVESLRNSRELRKRAVDFLCDDVLLADKIGTAKQASLLAATLGVKSSECDPGTKRPRAPSLPFRWPLLAFINRNGLAVAAMAALLMAGLLAHNVSMMRKVSRLYDLAVQGASQGEVEVIAGDTRGNAAENGASEGGAGDSSRLPRHDSVMLARVIGMKDLSVEAGEAALSLGELLEEGRRIRLASGALEVLLSTGAKVTAQGPVDFELTSLSKMDLQIGKIVAAVPRTARGYTIVTPTSELVDIGTQFGVSVATSGNTELHVFDGDVVARSRVPDSSSELLHAKENEGIRFDAASAEPQRFAASDVGFVRRIGPRLSPRDLPKIPRTVDLALWYAADEIPEAKPGDLVSVWRDIMAGDNQYANDARQFDERRCPRYGTDGQGRPIVLFNGLSTSLVVDPIDYTDAYTIFVAASPGPTSFADEYFGGILFKHGDAPTLELTVLNDFRPRGWVWPGNDKKNVGDLAGAKLVSPGAASVVAYQYDSATSHAQLWLNGESQGEADAPLNLRQTACAYLGSHANLDQKAYFFGGIYEVVIYDKALDADEMADLNSYFGERYGVSPAR